MKKFSVKKRITLALIIFGVSIFSVSAIVVFYYLENKWVDRSVQEITWLTVEQTHESTKIFEKDKIFAKMLGTRTRVKEFLNDRTEARRTELLGIFSDYVKEDSHILAIYLLDTDGTGLISTDSRLVGQNYSYRSYFKEAMEGRPKVDALMGVTTGTFGYYFSYPVIDDKDGKIIGVLVVKVDNQEIENAITESEVAKESSLMMVDEYGVVIASNKPERFLKSLGTLSFEKKELINQTDKFLKREISPLQYNEIQKIVENYKQTESFKLYDSVDKSQEVLIVTRIDDLPFYLVTEIGLESIENIIYSTLIIIILIAALGNLLFFFLIYRLIVFSLRPIKKFKDVSESISRGDFTKRMNLKNKDEFGELALVFDKMADSLEDLYKNLDEKVKERTLEIENKSQEVEKQKMAIVNILEDVQKEKIKSEELSNIVRDADEPIIGQSLDGLILSWNQGAEDLYQYKAEEMIGKPIRMIIPEDVQEDYEKIKEKIIAGEKVDHYQTKRRKKDGTLVDISASVSPIKDPTSGKITGISVIALDITKEKEIDKAKTEFVSLASHQLRTPLSAINWYSEMLLGGDAGKLNEDQERYMKEVYQGNQRMVALVNALLNVSRLDLGTFAIEPTPINLVEMAKDVLLELKPKILEKKLIIKENYSENLPAFQADKNLLRIIFQNLLSNSVKYTPENGNVNLNVSVTLKDQDFGGKKMAKDNITISVTDSGMGVPEDQKEKIFEKLFRADNARATESEGTGLGLYIVKSIIDKSGGDIWFDSVEGKGSAFYVTFPISGMTKKEGTRKLD
ncbi:MAG TPA: ATP-binding protein [Candidatus Paceibacterota bacterium]|nr:ATP-binding protein [Candidatus Paceibacterota bacterium]